MMTLWCGEHTTEFSTWSTYKLLQVDISGLNFSDL